MEGDAFQGRLLSGERLIWSGQPPRGIALTARDIFLIPFSFLWGGFAIFWESTVVLDHAPLFFMLWGVPFVLIGLFMIVGRFIADAWIRAHLFYALTNRRVLILRTGWPGSFTALPLEALPTTTLTERRDGRGTITFGQLSWFWRYRGFGSWLPAANGIPSFFRIADARRVYDQLQDLTAAARGTGGAPGV